MFRSTAMASALLVILLMSIAPIVSAAQVGLFMGAFDPPHQGIVRMIEESCSRLSLDFIYVVPIPEMIERPNLTPFSHRLAMIRLLAKDFPKVKTLTGDELQAILARNPKDLSAAIRADVMSRRPAADEVFQIIGEDALPALIEQDQLPPRGERRRVVVFARKGVVRTRHSSLEDYVRDGRLIRYDADIPDLASRDLLAQMNERAEPTSAQLPESIRAYILREGLYGFPGTLLSGKLLQSFKPYAYLALPVVLLDPKTRMKFNEASVEDFLGNNPAIADKNESDFSPELSLVLHHHRLKVVFIQGPTTDSLDWIKVMGWRVLHGYIPYGYPHSEKPSWFFGPQGKDWHLFVTGITDPNRLATLVREFQREFERLEIPRERLSLHLSLQD